MCNLYKLRATRAEVLATFDAADHWPADHRSANPLSADLARDYVAPGHYAPVIVAGDGNRACGLMTWGVPNAGKRVVNVRNLESPFWTAMLQRPSHRILVPATDFKEWSATPDPATGKKRPHWFALPARPLFAFAGIWRKVDDKSCFAFLTTEPNALVGAVHPKAMPVILDEADYDTWLAGPWEQARQFVTAYPSELMTMSYEVPQ